MTEDRSRIPGHREKCCSLKKVAAWWQDRDELAADLVRCGLCGHVRIAHCGPEGECGSDFVVAYCSCLRYHPS